MSWAGLAGSAVTVADSPYETARFGRTFARVVVGYEAVESVETDLADRIAATNADVVVVRYPSHLARLGAVLAASGRQVLPVDVLTYWEVPAAGAPTDWPGLTTRISDDFCPGTLVAVEQVVRDSFAGYGNHYTANPALDARAALDGYVEWVERAYATDPRNVVELLHDGHCVGVATLSHDHGDLEIELAGLTADSQGQGWYGALLAAVRDEAVRRACERVIISTQAANVRVQRSWVRAGFKPFAAVSTCHLMAR